jgi:DNA-binding response OmpR family regulator
MIKVLVVDDDVDLLEMVGLLLRSNKMDVCQLADAARLWRTLETFTPDFILLDVLLGSEDGRALCKRIKQETRFNRIPIYLYSAAFLSPASVHASGADGFLQKPFQMAELLSHIRGSVKG